MKYYVILASTTNKQQAFLRAYKLGQKFIINSEGKKLYLPTPQAGTEAQKEAYILQWIRSQK